MTTRIAILDDYLGVARSSAAWDTLPADCEVDVFDHHLGDDEAVVTTLAAFDVVVAMRERTPFPRAVLSRLPRLKLLVTTGMRNLAIDMDAARDHGITVCGTRTTGYAAFEHTWAMILGLAKNIGREDAAMHAGKWQVALNVGLRGRTLGVIGLGKLGSQVARIGLAFGMRVIAWSHNLTAERATEVGVERVDKETLLAESDFVTIHLILGDRSRGLIGADELARMKPGAYLVNTSRGPIVDEKALVDALRERRIAGAGLDVFDVEPLPADHPFRALDNTLLTGHTGYVVAEVFPLAYGEALENIKGWLGGKPTRVIG
ncbi:MAG: D-2-hydroxyacid dehydrogenase family protein [Ectothiorhodospiraceae bacterium]|nr:D-2-hydroxyacid dehydrogenase family protein [Chromatiales bacterium]MCP5154534.1 D-2-hydroxyacid dehydrogenase family protein [Ectothiorhodospiraceae bacterium]